MDLSVVIPVLNERENVERLLPRTARVLEQIGCSYELIVVDGGSRDGTEEAARAGGARVLRQQLPGYGGALREGLVAAQGDFILTLDADLSHDPDFIVKLWRARLRGDVVIASRYVRGGVAHMPRDRRALSRVLNAFFAYGLSLPVHDMSSGFRLYRASAVHELDLAGTNFEILEEILVKAYDAGWRVLEIPFTYYPRDTGSSHARIIRFGLDLLKAFARLWKLRKSIRAADYDERAFYSVIPLQRWWHRRRHELVCTWTRGAGKTLDVGCGSSVILQSLNDAVGIDVLRNKLRYMRRYDIPVVQASALSLPLRDETFECVVCSQVIERVADGDALFAELRRVLRPGGLLVLGTADYGTSAWRTIEPLYRLFAPGGYDDEHVTPYTRARLLELCRAWGFRVEHEGYVFGAEIVLALRKDVRPANVLPEHTSPAELPTPVDAERIRESG